METLFVESGHSEISRFSSHTCFPFGRNSGGLAEMRVSIREDLGGIEMWHHRQDLIERVDRVLEQLVGAGWSQAAQARSWN